VRTGNAHRAHISLPGIGYTVGNLESEARFFQHALVWLAPDDLLLAPLSCPNS
jgi:hypothetical protein